MVIVAHALIASLATAEEHERVATPRALSVIERSLLYYHKFCNEQQEVRKLRECSDRAVASEKKAGFERVPTTVIHSSEENADSLSCNQINRSIWLHLPHLS